MTFDTVARLRSDAARADELREEARRLLVDGARAAARDGLTQRQIADAMNRSQPEISRLLRFHGSTPLARSISKNRAAIIARLSAIGGTNIRIFGSVSRGQDTNESDLDLLVDFVTSPSLLELAEAESELENLLGSPVDVVSSRALRPHLAERALTEAVPL